MTSEIDFFMSTAKGEKEINLTIAALIPKSQLNSIVVFETFENIYESEPGVETDYQYFIDTYLKKIKNISS